MVDGCLRGHHIPQPVRGDDDEIIALSGVEGRQLGVRDQHALEILLALLFQLQITYGCNSKIYLQRGNDEAQKQDTVVPKARLTASDPCSLPFFTKPPAFATRAISSGSVPFRSKERSIATPLLDSTARVSPALAT